MTTTNKSVLVSKNYEQLFNYIINNNNNGEHKHETDHYNNYNL